MSSVFVSSVMSALNDKAKIVIVVVCALVLLWMIVMLIHWACKRKRKAPAKQEASALPVEDEKPEEPMVAPAPAVQSEPEKAIEPVEEVAPEEDEDLPEISLSESIAEAKDFGAAGIVTKQSIIDHLAARFDDKVELNGRENRTPNGKLLLSDNHFAFSANGKRVCFAYVYQDDDGDVIILVRTTAEHAHAIHSAHPHTGVRSAFPKNKERDWYSVVVDDTFSEKDVYDVLDTAAAYIIGETVVEEEEDESKEFSLSESLAEAKDIGAAGIVTKQSIIDHLNAKFGDKVELNPRENRTPNGKLLLSDNHFAFSPKGKRVCFTYVYEDDDGDVILLVRTTAEHAHAIRAEHRATGIRSSFPKNKENDWYSVVVDDTFSENNVYDVLDKAVYNIIGTAEPVPEEHAFTLSESIAAAKDIGAVGIVTKKTIIDHLNAKFGDKVELNGRDNRTPNGKLLLSDNHFAVEGKNRVCFSYVYEDEGKVILLLRLSDAEGAALHAEHKGTVVKSAFPKNKDNDWYSVVVEGTFTEEKVYAALEEAYRYVLTK